MGWRWLLARLWLEDVTEAFEVDVNAVDRDAFGFEALGLLDTIGATEEDLSSPVIDLADDAMPGQRWVRSLERPGCLTGACREASC